MEFELSDLLTVGGASAIVLILLQVIKPALGLSPQAWDRFGALIAIGFGALIVVLGDLALGSPVHYLQAVIVGILAGAAASGFYDAGKGTGTAISDRASKPPLSDYQASDYP